MMSDKKQRLLIAIDDWFASIEGTTDAAMVRQLLANGGPVALYNWYKDHPSFPMLLFRQVLTEMN